MKISNRQVRLVRLVHLIRLQTDNFSFFSSPANGQTTNFRLHDEQTVFPFPFDVSMSPCVHAFMSTLLHVSMALCLHDSITSCFHISMFPCLHVPMSMSLRFRYSANRKQKIPFVLCKQKTVIANFLMFAAYRNGKKTFVFLGRQTNNGNRGSVFQQRFPSFESQC
jgi:hypothetical protein